MLAIHETFFPNLHQDRNDDLTCSEFCADSRSSSPLNMSPNTSSSLPPVSPEKEKTSPPPPAEDKGGTPLPSSDSGLSVLLVNCRFFLHS